MTKKKKGRILITILAALIFFGTLCADALFVLNRYVVKVSSDYILSEAEAAELEAVDCILILGAGVYSNKYPSLMLQDRLDKGIELYELGVSDRILMSGDNSEIDYNEVLVMKDYAVEAGIPGDNIFQDHAGFSTYESMYRARDVFAAEKIVVVTQSYHLYRALYDARALGLEAYGVMAEDVDYRGQTLRDLRELLARVKDVVYCAFKFQPTFLGDVIPISGNGSVTD